MPVVESIRVEPQEEEILRLLSRGKGKKEAGEWTLDLVREAAKEAKDLVWACGVYEIVGRSTLPKESVFASGERVALCVCTIGARLEARVRELMNRGELARAVALDAVGSELAEDAARRLDERIGNEGSGNGLLPSARFSPGYGKWKLEGQRLVFDLLHPGQIGVELSVSMMMNPRKSVSFAINFGKEPQPPRCSSPCDQCDMEDCGFRKE